MREAARANRKAEMAREEAEETEPTSEPFDLLEETPEPSEANEETPEEPEPETGRWSRRGRRKVSEGKPAEDNPVVDLLARAVPEIDSVSFYDISGTEYKVPVLLSARRQVQIARRWKSFAADFGGDDLKLTAENLSDLLMDAVLDLVEEDGEIYDLLVETFEAIHPHAINAARSGKAGQGLASLDPDWLEGDAPAVLPADELFPLEEMALSIIPFSVRIVRRITGAFDRPVI